MANIGNDFFRHLRNKKIKKDDIIIQKYQNNVYTTLNLKDELVSKVDVEKKNKKYKLKGEKTEKLEISPIEIRKKDNLIEIDKKDEVVVKAKLEEEVLKQLERDIKKNRKFELKVEDINEKNIKNELNKLIEKDKKDVKEINEEINDIEEKIKKCKKNEYIKEYEEKLAKIKSRLGVIKEHYEVISDYYDFKGYANLKNTLLINSIEDFKTYKTNEEIENLVLHCKEEGKKLDVIIEATNKCIKADKKVLEVRKYNEKRDEEYLKEKEKIALIDEGYKKISYNVKEQDEFLSKLDDDIFYLNYKLSDIKLFRSSSSLLTNILNISICTNLMPVFPGFRLLFQAIILKNLTETARKLFNPDIKREIITKDIVSSYIKIIYDNKKNMDLIIKYLDDSISNVKELKKDFIKKFEEHKDILDDYDEYLHKIDSALEKLEEKNKLINEYKQELNKKEQKVLELKSS